MGDAASPTQWKLPGERHFSIIKLLNQPLDALEFQPKLYFSASQEVFLYTLILTWAVTLYVSPEQIFEHPFRPVIGSLNPCFGWDYPPASYIAVFCCSFNVYFTWRFAWLERTRTRLLNPGTLEWHERLEYYACHALALSSNGWLLLFVIGPNQADAFTGLRPADRSDIVQWHVHVGLFILYAGCSYLVFLGTYVEVRFGKRPWVLTPSHTAFVWVYGLVVGFLVFAYVYEFAMYDINGADATKLNCCAPGDDVVVLSSEDGEVHGYPSSMPLMRVCTVPSQDSLAEAL